MPRRLSRRQIAHYCVAQLSSGAPTTHLVRQLAAYLIESRRTNELDVILRDVQYELAQTGYVTGTVTVAHQLEVEVRQRIEAYVRRVTGAETVHLDIRHDPTVLGGVKITLPGLERDATVLRHLRRLKTEYRKV